jgi:hypothetical protein
MDPLPATTEPDCPGCRAAAGTTEARCFLCGKPVLPLSGTDPPTAPSEPLRFTFSLSSLMLLMTLIAVCLGLGGIDPGLGIGVAFLVTPAALRTAVAAARRRRSGSGMSMGEKLLAFVASLGVVTAMIVATGVAFYATCWAGFFGGDMLSEPFAKGYDGLFVGLGTGIILGGVVGLYVLYRMARWLWPRKG